MNNHLCAILISAAILSGCSTTSSTSEPHSAQSQITAHEITPPSSATNTLATPIHAQCHKITIKPVTVDVSSTFSNGEWVKDAYTGKQAQVIDNHITLLPGKRSGGVLLLESATATKPEFNWNNATFYYVATDRFYNGKTVNDHSYSRSKDNQQNIGTFHGGDLVGLTQKLDYLAELGVNALWISSPIEQVHGWVVGGDGDFKLYPYAGGSALDWTRLDASMGTNRELKQLMDQAHALGIRVIWDIELSPAKHPTLTDMQQYHIGSPSNLQALPDFWSDWTPSDSASTKNQNWSAARDFSPSSTSSQWWHSAWYSQAHSTSEAQLPKFYQHKLDTYAQSQPYTSAPEYIVEWLTQWVEDYGIDGFYINDDSATEHTLALLQQRSQQALSQWQQKYRYTQNNETDFILIGSSSTPKNALRFTLDSTTTQQVASAAQHCFTQPQALFDTNTAKTEISYLSSPEEHLFWQQYTTQLEQQQLASTLLALQSGPIRLFYGDEIARQRGPSGSDLRQGNFSPMPWDSLTRHQQQLRAHWKKLLKFRAKHPALGAGKHQNLSNQNYDAFSRQLENDKVMVVFSGHQTNK
ncbi:alpha-amylase family glycosyl hydrolase [Vibrio sp. Of7-15]|uniref:alpha-amylase family glycosyl hydrolase n=1 Tax=Vibrio sp. Of7-15 TaxID=2724879 RepID=UPI001EF29226|nr:alpha-amylase family glycosyl hydrolase [Vibrio sp. Of7-15]MCG7499301.1 alpha-amylase family glycosyl hydrolase [Vibrio sp. Of7-15]